MAEDNNPNKKDQDSEDDDFGMPKVDITPVGEDADDSKKLPQPVVASGTVPTAGEEESVKAEPVEEKPKEKKKNRSGFFVVLLILLLLGAAFALYYTGAFDQLGGSGPSTSTTPPPADEPADEVVPPAPDELAEEPTPEVDETFSLTEITSKINVPRYFVVVGSFIDPDMAKDYSIRLNNMNKNTFLIHPYDDISFYRLAVGQHENLSGAVTQMENIQGDFEENLWVLKY